MTQAPSSHQAAIATAFLFSLTQNVLNCSTGDLQELRVRMGELVAATVKGRANPRYRFLTCMAGAMQTYIEDELRRTALRQQTFLQKQGDPHVTPPETPG